MTEEDLPKKWNAFRLDQRILEAVRLLRWKTPTVVQQASIPQILLGHDVAVQSRTGSGKTGAFALPLIQRILDERSKKATLPIALVVVPSVELCQQTFEVVTAAAKYIRPRVVVENLCERRTQGDCFGAVDAIVTTPAILAKLLKGGQVANGLMQHLRLLVIDEADLLVSTTSLRIVQSALPTTIQTVLLSATLTEGVASIQGQLLHQPVNIKLTEETVEDVETDAVPTGQPVVENRVVLKDTRSTLKQHYLVATDECHQYTLLYGLLRLGVIEGKTLIFVEDEHDTYKLQHFLEQLSISTVVYDPQLPLNVRLHMLHRFQSGAVATLICTDGTLEKAERLEVERNVGKDAAKKMGTDSSLYRGIDFNKVRNVIIFDGMDSPSALNFSKYVHRVGRTGRAGELGNSIIIFTVPQTQAVTRSLREYLKGRGETFRPFKQLDRSQAAALQYRVDSALAKVTRTASRRLRVSTVAAEITRNQYLSSHLNEGDTEALRRIVERSKKSVRSDSNIIRIPKYMNVNADDPNAFAKRVNGKDRMRKEQLFQRATRKAPEDPLQKVVQKVREGKRKRSE